MTDWLDISKEKQTSGNSATFLNGRNRPRSPLDLGEESLGWSQVVMIGFVSSEKKDPQLRKYLTFICRRVCWRFFLINN